MEPINRHSLEEYAERHRADFDLHEPRPELWAALEKQLHGESAVVAEAPRMTIATDYPAESTQPAPAPLAAQPALRVQKNDRWQRYGLAAALALLLVAAGVGEAWKANHEPTVAAQTTATTNAVALDLSPDPSALPASQGGADVDARLDTAVHGMERYYVAQLTDRKTQLSQLAPTATAEWARELVGLDSSYQQLKRELPRHPQPEVVLTAMNRNLQIRLDILDRQLELHGADQPALAGSNGNTNGEYALADSRGATETFRRNAR